MENSSQLIINVAELEQVCIVVSEIDKSVESMWNTFGIGPWNINVHNADSLNNMTYHGKPARFGFKVARTQSKLGGLEIELIEPVEGDNIYNDFLREHGEGIHHLGWHKVDSLEAFAETSRMLEKGGFPCIMSGSSYRGAFAYFDTTKVLNTILEVIWRNPLVRPRTPDRVFPS